MRLLHTMLRVTDLEATLRFYCDLLGMRLLRSSGGVYCWVMGVLCASADCPLADTD